jgi:hypothetical protein
MTKRDEMDTQTLEDAAKAAFKQAQNVYRLNYDHFPLKNTWESVDESIRDGWRKIVSAALRVGAPPLDEYEVAEALAPYFEEGFTPRDGARAVMMLIGKRLSAQAEPGYVVKPLVWIDHRPDSFPEPAWSAHTPFGFYNIEEVSASDSPAYVVRLHAHHFVADKDSLADAQKTAQADYEQRIRSAIAALPAPATASAGWQLIDSAPKDGKSYEISTDGRVRVDGNIREPFLTDKGYLRVTIGEKSISVHRLVAQTFIPNPLMKKEVNHKDGVKTNNCVANLEWSTRSENMKHAYAAGLHPGVSVSGPQHPMFGRKGSLHKQSMPVRASFPDGTHKDYESQSAAAVDGFRPSKISQCIGGGIKSHGGAVWMPLPAAPTIAKRSAT